MTISRKKPSSELPKDTGNTKKEGATKTSAPKSFTLRSLYQPTTTLTDKPTAKPIPEAPAKETWNIITEDLKHSANMWDILEDRAKKDNGIKEVREELERIKSILEQHNF